MTKHTHFKFKMVLSGKLGHKLDHFKFKMVLSGKLGHKLHHFNFNIALSGKIRQWCLERKKIFCGGDSFSKPINRLLHQGIKHQGIHKYISLLPNWKRIPQILEALKLQSSQASKFPRIPKDQESTLRSSSNPPSRSSPNGP